ncbi:MAG: Triosephosphate isomerase [Parcubacteria group bacterium GW2011_GWF2_39_13b]|nr:MAG: Triosephosphate isomerase [Parcubacteria group bacterium GW2011_GWF2_39_13b]
MNKKLIIANWKMNPQSPKEARKLFLAFEENSKSVKNVEVVVCPPFVFSGFLDARIYSGDKKSKASFGIHLGAQNCLWEQSGPYTGEISPAMLKSIGCEYVILGHSERRQFFGETDEVINKKLKAVLSVRLRPILCIGERADEKEQLKSVLESQLKGCLEGIKQNQIANIIFAYEPVWAISTSGGEFCSSDDAFSASLLIRKFLIDRYGKYAANKAKIIYGGSVDAKEKDAAMYVQEAKMDGVLVGAASLKAEEFGKIIKRVNEIKI